MVEPQTQIPQLQIELDRHQLARYGLLPDDARQRFVTDPIRLPAFILHAIFGGA